MPKPVYRKKYTKHYHSCEQSSTLFLGDCLDVLKDFPDNEFDSIVTDPPYGIKFMNKHWDHSVPTVEVWQECLRVLKPGGFLLSFGGCRTYHRLVCNIEDAGFTIHPLIAWVFGSGFPKATNLSKQIDKAAGAEREVVGKHPVPCANKNATVAHGGAYQESPNITAPATDAAKQWDGYFYGLQALKPAIEPICMAQKPYDGKPVESIQKWQCGALNIDGCRVDFINEDDKGDPNRFKKAWSSDGSNKGWKREAHKHYTTIPVGSKGGRHPANLILDGSAEVLEGFPETGASKSAPRGSVQRYDPADIEAKRPKGGNGIRGHDDAGGSAARFFYCAKASKRERNEGVPEDIGNKHPTVKPLALMTYLCRLVTPPNGIILDPFMGSGTTGVAAIQEGFGFVGMDTDKETIETAKHRVKAAKRKTPTK